MYTIQNHKKKVNSPKKQQNCHHLSQPNALQINISSISKVANSNKLYVGDVFCIMTYLRMQSADITQSWTSASLDNILKFLNMKWQLDGEFLDWELFSHLFTSFVKADSRVASAKVNRRTDLVFKYEDCGFELLRYKMNFMLVTAKTQIDHYLFKISLKYLYSIDC